MNEISSLKADFLLIKLDKKIKIYKDSMSIKKREGGMTGKVSELKPKLIQQRKKILNYLTGRPNLRQFIQNAISRLSLNAMAAIVNFARQYRGDIDPADVQKVGEKIRGKHKSIARLPAGISSFNLRKFPQAERELIRLIALSIHYFYQAKADSE